MGFLIQMGENFPEEAKECNYPGKVELRGSKPVERISRALPKTLKEVHPTMSAINNNSVDYPFSCHRVQKIFGKCLVYCSYRKRGVPVGK